MIQILCFLIPSFISGIIFEKIQRKQFNIKNFLAIYMILTGIISMFYFGVITVFFQHPNWIVYGDNISEKRGKGRDWRGQVWKRPDFRRFCGGTAPVQGRDVAVILRKTASAAVGAFFAPGKAPGGPTSGAAGDDAQAYESPQKRRRQAIPGGLWYKMSRMASSRKSQQQTLEDEPPGP